MQRKGGRLEVGGGGSIQRVSLQQSDRGRRKGGSVSLVSVTFCEQPSIFRFTRRQLADWLSLFDAELSPKRP